MKKIILKEVIDKAWLNHGANPKLALQGLVDFTASEISDEDCGYFSELLIHVLGGHLNRYEETKEVLIELLAGRSETAKKPLYKGLAIVETCLGNHDEAGLYGKRACDGNFNETIFTDILARASFLTSHLKITDTSKTLFEDAISLSSRVLHTNDPAARSLAIAGNQFASFLEEKENLAKEEMELLILSSKTARKYWEITGGSLEIERAEYILAMSYLKVMDLEKASVHARNCESICLEENLGNLELFFAYEALTKINRAKCVKYRNSLSEDQKTWCTVP